MFRFIKKMLIGLLSGRTARSFSALLWHSEERTKCVSSKN